MQFLCCDWNREHLWEMNSSRVHLCVHVVILWSPTTHVYAHFETLRERTMRREKVRFLAWWWSNHEPCRRTCVLLRERLQAPCMHHQEDIPREQDRSFPLLQKEMCCLRLPFFLQSGGCMCMQQKSIYTQNTVWNMCDIILQNIY